MVIEILKASTESLSPARAEIIQQNIRRIIETGDMTLLYRSAYYFLIEHYRFIHNDSHFNFVTHYRKKENLIFFLRTIYNANKVCHPNPIVSLTLQRLLAIVTEAIDDEQLIGSFVKAA